MIESVLGPAMHRGANSARLAEFVAVFFNDGTGRHFNPIAFGDKNGSAYGFALGDINKDGFPDIALARSGAPNVLYLSGK